MWYYHKKCGCITDRPECKHSEKWELLTPKAAAWITPKLKIVEYRTIGENKIIVGLMNPISWKLKKPEIVSINKSPTGHKVINTIHLCGQNMLLRSLTPNNIIGATMFRPHKLKK
jgi:hypothetical protein